LWVDREVDARSPLVAPTRLWDRWTRRADDASPFAVVVRPSDDATTGDPPFPFARYEAPYLSVAGHLPAGTAIDYAIETPLEEPGLFNLGFVRGGRPGRGALTRVTVSVPPAPRSEALRAAIAGRLLDVRDGDHHLRLEFDRGASGRSIEVAPLRLTLVW
jgi:hypothetical protein